MRTVLCILACVGLALAMAQPNGLYQAYSALPAHPLESELFARSNAVRREAGLEPLLFDPQLALAARQHAAEMAALNYLSHTSPTDSTATLPQRLARAGSPALRASENLADVAADDAIARSIQGWLDSPGHRRNFLNPDHSHMAVALAEGEGGRIFAVQLFANQPLVLQDSTLHASSRQMVRLELVVRLRQAREVSLFHGDTSSPAQRLSAGSHPYSVLLSSHTRTHVRLGVRVPGTEQAFVLEDEGWLEPQAQRFVLNPVAPKRVAAIENVRLEPAQQRGYHVTLRFAEPLPAGVAVFLGDAHVPDLLQTERTLQFTLSDTSSPSEGQRFHIALPKGNGRYRVVMELETLRQAGRSYLLVPALPLND